MVEPRTINLGESLSSTVFNGRLAATQEAVIVKKIQNSLSVKRRYKIFADTGASLVAALEVTDEKTLWVAERLYSGGSLRALVEAKGPLPAGDLRLLAKNLLECLSRLHSLEAYHGGLSQSAIYFEEEGSWKCYFAALEMAEDAEDDMLCVSQKTCAVMTKANDVWQIGRVLLYAATGQQPRHISHYSFQHRSFEKLVTAMLDAEEDSPSATQLLEFPFFTETDLHGPVITLRTLVEISALRDQLDYNCLHHLAGDEKLSRDVRDSRWKIYRIIMDALERDEWEKKEGTDERQVYHDMLKLATASLRTGAEYQSHQFYDLAAYCYFRTLACVKLWSESNAARELSWKPGERLSRVAFANLKNLRSRGPVKASS